MVRAHKTSKAANTRKGSRKGSKMDGLKPEQTEEGQYIPAHILAQAEAAAKMVAGDSADQGTQDVGLEYSEGAQADQGQQEAAANDDFQQQEAATATAMDPETLMKELEKERQKYKVLQGKYNAEVKGAQQTSPEIVNELATLKNMVNALAMSMQQQGQQQTGNQHQSQAEPDELANLKDEDFEDYGDEMKSLVKAVKAMAQRNPQSDTLASLKADVEATKQAMAMTAKERFFADLSDKVPTWRVLNKDQEWIGFLQGNDPLSGVKYQALLDDAQQRGDTERIKRIFEAWPGYATKDAEARRQLGVAATQQAAQRQQQRQFVEPSTAAGSFNRAADLGRQVDVVTNEQLVKAGQDFARGRITEKEFDEISMKHTRYLAQQKAAPKRSPGAFV